MRAFAFALILALAIAALWASERKPVHPLLIEAGFPVRVTEPPAMLFAPCPLGPRNFRRFEERKA
jgi:hypothetical protein